MGKSFFDIEADEKAYRFDLDLIKEKFADFLKKPNGSYGNLDEIATYVEDNGGIDKFKAVFNGMKKEDVIADLKKTNKPYESLKKIIKFKDYK